MIANSFCEEIALFTSGNDDALSPSQKDGQRLALGDAVFFAAIVEAFCDTDILHKGKDRVRPWMAKLPQRRKVVKGFEEEGKRRNEGNK